MWNGSPKLLNFLTNLIFRCRSNNPKFNFQHLRANRPGSAFFPLPHIIMSPPFTVEVINKVKFWRTIRSGQTNFLRFLDVAEVCNQGGKFSFSADDILSSLRGESSIACEPTSLAFRLENGNTFCDESGLTPKELSSERKKKSFCQFLFLDAGLNRNRDLWVQILGVCRGSCIRPCLG